MNKEKFTSVRESFAEEFDGDRFKNMAQKQNEMVREARLNISKYKRELKLTNELVKDKETMLNLSEYGDLKLFDETNEEMREKIGKLKYAAQDLEEKISQEEIKLNQARQAKDFSKKQEKKMKKAEKHYLKQEAKDRKELKKQEMKESKLSLKDRFSLAWNSKAMRTTRAVTAAATVGSSAAFKMAGRVTQKGFNKMKKKHNMYNLKAERTIQSLGMDPKNKKLNYIAAYSSAASEDAVGKFVGANHKMSETFGKMFNYAKKTKLGRTLKSGKDLMVDTYNEKSKSIAMKQGETLSKKHSKGLAR